MNGLQILKDTAVVDLEQNLRTKFLSIPENTRLKLEIKDVSKTFNTRDGRICALNRINLTIKEGEFTCVVGPSGCGKSTLLHLIAELEAPDKGEIILYSTEDEGRLVERLIVFQESALFPWLTVLENVAFGLRIKGMRYRERVERAMDYLHLVRLSKFAHCYIHELSGGMKQRVALARALAMNPEVLLMDEPFAALDIQTRENLSRELEEIWSKTGKTIIFVTHNVEEAVTLGDRVILFSGRPGTVQKEYRLNLSRPRQRENPLLKEMINLISNDFKRLDGASINEATG
ncbi:MAG TPA: ABC transporter ATP-binding protein [Firmicutes bacterium]|nr:ABC transporter ATP-binding protein [Bacillota bacterium]